MKYPRTLVNKFGGVRAMSRATGIPATTIASWLSRGAIHDLHKAKIIAAATKAGVTLDPKDFLPCPIPPPQP